MALRHKKPVPQFIKKPLFDTRDDFVSDLYNMIYFPSYQLDFFEKQNIHGISKPLYKLTEIIVKNATYQLHAVPAVRMYYDGEFVQGFMAKYDEREKELKYINIDDTIQADEFLKEMTRIIEIVLWNFLIKYDIYIHYLGESIQFITGEEKDKMKRINTQGRIVWVK